MNSQKRCESPLNDLDRSRNNSPVLHKTFFWHVLFSAMYFLLCLLCWRFVNNILFMLTFRISVLLKDGGMKMMQITDNGCGIMVYFPHGNVLNMLRVTKQIHFQIFMRGCAFIRKKILVLSAKDLPPPNFLHLMIFRLCRHLVFEARYFV